MKRSTPLIVGVIPLMHLLSCQAFDFESNQSHTTAPSKSKTTIGLLIDETTTNVLTNQTDDADFATSTIQTSTGETVTPAVYTMTSFSTGTSVQQNETIDYTTTIIFSPASLTTSMSVETVTAIDQSLGLIKNVTGISTFVDSGNWSSIVTCRLACQHGGRCVRDGTDHWCKCSWAFSGRYCESVLPLYLALSLIGGGVILLFLFGLSILLCVKLVISKRAPMQAKTVDRTSFTDTFHKPEPGAVYVDPSLYYGTLCRTTLTPSRLSSGGGGRPRLNLESFENSHYQEQQQISPSRNNDDKNMEHYHSPYKNRNSYNETRIDDDSPPLPRHVLES